MISKYRRTVNKEFEESSFWPTFTDLISTVLMVVILILFSSESIVGSVEQDVAKNINNSVKEALKDDGLEISINKNSGQVTFGEKTMFDTGSYELKDEAKKMLKKFIPKYVDAIYKDYDESISKVIIEGHTDDVGSYIYNLELSQKRAYSVVEYMVGEDIGDYKYKDKLTKDIVAIGRSQAELIKTDSGEINRNASRRVEIKYEINIK